MFNQYKMAQHKPYSITDKLAVSASVKCGESQASVSHTNGVQESTICGWLIDTGKLHDFIDTVNSTDWIKESKNCQRLII